MYGFWLNGASLLGGLVLEVSMEGLIYWDVQIVWRSLANTKDFLSSHRKCGRAVECGGLENRCTARYRGFESLHFRPSSLLRVQGGILFMGVGEGCECGDWAYLRGMGSSSFARDAGAQSDQMRRFYRVQSKLYDWTRWAFLFGRRGMVDRLVLPRPDAVIVEVGCGTGQNLLQLGRRFPGTRLIGYDVSGDMLARAERKLRKGGVRAELRHAPYGAEALGLVPDVILFSYSLTMINPQWAELIWRAWEDLGVGGQIAVVDFHDTGSGLLTWHMERSHVRMDGHLLPVLEKGFEGRHVALRKAYGGWWRWVEFVGVKKDRG